MQVCRYTCDITGGASEDIRTPEIEEAVLNALENDPSMSTIKIASVLAIIHFVVWKIFLIYYIRTIFKW